MPLALPPKPGLLFLPHPPLPPPALIMADRSATCAWRASKLLEVFMAASAAMDPITIGVLNLPRMTANSLWPWRKALSLSTSSW